MIKEYYFKVVGLLLVAWISIIPLLLLLEYTNELVFLVGIVLYVPLVALLLVSFICGKLEDEP